MEVDVLVGHAVDSEPLEGEMRCSLDLAGRLRQSLNLWSFQEYLVRGRGLGIIPVFVQRLQIGGVVVRHDWCARMVSYLKRRPCFWEFI